MRYLLLFLSIVSTSTLFAQVDSSVSNLSPEVLLESLSATELRADIRARGVFTLALPDGTGAETEHDCAVEEVFPMHPKLAARYPQIRSYHGTAPDGSTATLTLHDEQIFGVLRIGGEPERAIRPHPDGRHRLVTQTYDPATFCGMETPPVTDSRPTDPAAGTLRNADGISATGRADTLYTYRLAFSLAAVTFQGQGFTQTSEGLALVSNHVATANPIFQRDFGVRFELIPNNDVLIYTDPATDPFDEFPNAVDANAFIYDNHNNLETVIGAGNYDIGHMVGNVSTGRGWLKSVCSSNDTGRAGSDNWNAQIRHELGHQLDAHHTYQRVDDGDNGQLDRLVAYNMGWYGDHFHSDNYFRVANHVIHGNGNSCAVKTVQNRTAPVMSHTATNGTAIPANTPFVLENTATTDPDAGADLKYTWQHLGGGPVGGAYDQRDVTPQEHLVWAPRAFDAANTVRYVPAITHLMNGTKDPNAVLPTVTRTLTYRFVAIDNETPVGGVNYREETLEVHNTGTPFTVTGPSADVNAVGGQPMTVTWNVAGTTAAPISAATVDVYLTQDEGATWTQIATNLTNNGSADVTLPASATTNNAKTARILVRGTGRAFFNLSPENFEIVPAGTSEFRVVSDDDRLVPCASNQTVNGSLRVLPRGIYSNAVTVNATNLPSGATVTGLPATVALGTTVNYSIDLTNATMTEPLNLQLTGTEGSLTHTGEVFLAAPRGAVNPTQQAHLRMSYQYPDLSEPRTAFTIEFWINPERHESQFNRIEWGNFAASFANAGSSPQQSTFNVQISGGGSVQSGVIVKGKWTHVAMVYDQPDVRVYTNGELTGSFTSTKDITGWANGLFLGKTTYWYRGLYGRFDQIRVWSRALPQTEIREWMHLPRGRDAVCNDNLEVNIQYSSGAHYDHAGKYELVKATTTDDGYGTTESVESNTAPTGLGTAHRQTVTTAGPVAFNNGLHIDFGTAPAGELVVSRLSGYPHGTIPVFGADDMDTYWVVDNRGATQTGLNATMTFTEAGFVTDPDPAKYHLYKRGTNESGTWEGPFPATGIDATAGSVTFSGIDEFSQFYLSRSNNAVLPVEWLDFTARAEGRVGVRLDWATALEINNAGFDVERSTDGRTFQTIGWVPGQNKASHYEFLDRELPAAAAVLYYRLRQVDTDGRQSYSGVRSVVLERPGGYVLFPNPATEAVTLTTAAPSGASVTVRLLDVLGRPVWERRFAATTTRELDLSTLARGTYLVEVTDGATVWTERLVLD